MTNQTVVSAGSRSERVQLAEIVQRHDTFRFGIRWLGIVGTAYFVSQAFATLAGEETSVVVNMTLSVLADLKFALAVTLAGAAAIWAIVERGLRRRKVEKMQERIRELETAIDPNRTSSGLLPDGRTNPADR